MRRQIIPITPAATSRIASAPRIMSGSGNESASPGVSWSSAFATPFGFGRPIVVVGGGGGGGVTCCSVVVGAGGGGGGGGGGAACCSVGVGSAGGGGGGGGGGASVVVGVVAALFSAISRAMARSKSSFALE